MRERKDRLDTLAVSLLLACCLFWGFQQILIRTTVDEVPPLWQASLRFAGATALLLLDCCEHLEIVVQSLDAARVAACCSGRAASTTPQDESYRTGVARLTLRLRLAA